MSVNTKQVVTGFWKVERFFNEEGRIAFVDIVGSMIQEQVESLLNASYDDNRVNVAASHGEVA